MRRVISLTALLLFTNLTFAQGNLLRNGEFQDDWITMLPETKNHHWCFPSEFFNRRDYNPDGWYCKGSWDWQNADAPWGQRRMVVNGPATLSQRVNWLAIHDDRKLEGFPDAGGFPVMQSPALVRPERVVRDLTFRVKLAGTDVPKDAGVLEIGVNPPGGSSTSDPMGTPTPPIARVSLKLPAGTFAPQWFEIKLAAADVLKAMTAKASPALIAVSIQYTAKTGKLDIDRAELIAAPSDAPNLLANGGFESLGQAGYPTGWSKPIKYTYFPPRHYYIFNTWHNTNFANRGTVEIDKLLPYSGRHSLRMILPPGDETAVVSEPIVLNQKEVRLIEVRAWIKTDRLCNLQIDGHDEKGSRLDCFNFIHKAPVSIGTDSWRLIRQVFRPRTPVQALRLVLAARGVNGYTLDDTSMQPQNNVVGTLWWDDVRVHEPEALATELQERGVKPVVEADVKSGPRLVELDLGERLVGQNILQVVVHNPGPAQDFSLQWVWSSGGVDTSFRTKSQKIPANSQAAFTIPYQLKDSLPAYSEFHGFLDLFDGKERIAEAHVRFSTPSTPVKLDLGALYLRPEQKQYVRMNLGFTQATMAQLKTVQLDVTHRDGKILKSIAVDATPKAILAQRAKIPTELRDDFANLLLADVDVSFLRVQSFADPQRNWIIRASAITNDGKTIATVDSQPFCRLAHDAPQLPIKDVTIKNGMTWINGQPWMPFGVTYGHTPVYDGPADPGKYRDLRNLPGWSMYDRHNGNSSNRKQYDFNCLRYVAGSITKLDALDKRWQADNLYCSSAFAIPTHAFALKEMFKLAGGQDKLDAYLDGCKKSPTVVSIAPGIEEAFGLFQGATPAELKGLAELVDYTRKKAGRPVMVGHGGYWNRLEFEKVPFFDIFDPETEPLYPANLHTDLAPLVESRALAPRVRLDSRSESATLGNKVVWLRPQMYESIPYERWRFHTYVELMRGCRGWQVAHGPGDSSLFRGLHGEMEYWKPIVANGTPTSLQVEPSLEHRAWQHNGKTYAIAATTRGIPFGRWDAIDEEYPSGKRVRVTQDRHELRDETNAYGIGQKPESGVAAHGIQYLPDATRWPKGSTLVQWVKLDAKTPPKGIVLLAKADGRWTHAAGFGKNDLTRLRKDPDTAYWFLNVFYRHAKGFLGWGRDLLSKSLDYIPDQAVVIGDVPEAGRWVKLEVPLERIGATDKLLDGVGFLHEDGRVWWGRTSIVAPDGKKVVWGDTVELPPADLAKVKIRADGLKAGTRVRVLFEDRELVAQAGYFEDDFRGQDLYQRHGGGAGYGSAPVALHLYEW